MSMFFYNRLTQAETEDFDKCFTILGQWFFSKDLPKGSFLNSVPVSANDFLVPDISGGWAFLSPAGSRFEGSYPKLQLPDELESESIRTLGGHLKQLVTQEGSWCDWLDIVPLVPGMSEAVEILPLEKKIRESFGHLESVCTKPRAHLHVEVERVNIAKARRVPASAPAYLAAHTEDWDRPLLKGVLPKRVLAEVRHDQVDIYENRVAARLVDNLLFYLQRRIQIVSKLLKVFADKENYSSKAGGTYMRQSRILELWGNSIDSNEGRKKAEGTLKKLEWLKYKLMGLMDSPLYREVPKRSYVATTLRMTNILANDQHYRHVAELWTEWSMSGFSRSKSPKEVYSTYQELCSGLDRFATLLIVRALHALGYAPADDALAKTIFPGCMFPIVGNGIRFDFSWESDGTVSINLGKIRLRFIAFANNFALCANEDQAQAVFDKCKPLTGNDGEKIVLLYASSDERKSSVLPFETQRSLHAVGNDPRTTIPPSVGLLPVSPWEIGSVERIARALRWHLDSERFLDCPISLSVDNAVTVDLKAGVRDGWLEVSQGAIKIMRPPMDFEWQQLDLEGQLLQARSKLVEVEIEHERLSAELWDAVRDGKTGKLNQQKKAAQQEKTTLGKRVESLERLVKDFETARVKMESLVKCPACGTKADSKLHFEVRGKGSFRCECPDCGTWWGTKICERGHKYSVMLPGEWYETETMSAGWEDITYGSDLLAVPDKTERGEWGFVCPYCGVVTT